MFSWYQLGLVLRRAVRYGHGRVQGVDGMGPSGLGNEFMEPDADGTTWELVCGYFSVVRFQPTHVYIVHYRFFFFFKVSQESESVRERRSIENSSRTEQSSTVREMFISKQT